jgi:4-amino-4-deoxy-L-arabinose transferase-like glycosyltransferase
MKTLPMWIAIAVGMAARLVWAVFGTDAVILDAAGYRALARSLADGHGYATALGPSAYWMPGWPAWMAVLYRIGASDTGIVLMNVALGGATVLLTYALARELLPEAPKIARLAASLCALTPSLVLVPRLLLSENLALPLFTLATLALAVARRTRLLRHWALFAVAAAAATFVRESLGAIVLAGLVFALARGPSKTRALGVAVVVGTFSMAVLPWVMRNRSELGITTLTTSAGVNLCMGLGEGATGGYRTVCSEGVTQQEVDVHELGLRCAREGLVHHPLALLTLAPAKLSRLVAWDDWIVDDFLASEGHEALPRALLWLLRILCDGVYWMLGVGAVIGGWRARPFTRVPAAVIAAACAPVLVTFGAGRFHTPLLPLLAMLAAFGWCYRRAS